MLDVTVVLLDDGLSSTAVIPVEIFHSAGALWNEIHDREPEPAFRVTTVSLDGSRVRSPTGVDIMPQASLGEIEKTDVVIMPTSGLELDGKLIQNRALAPWLRKHYDAGAYVCGVCMGSAYLAEAGLLDGRIATTHWAVAEQFARRYPQVNWRPDLFITEEARLLCSGGLYASMDLSLYMVEKLCGHEIATQCAKAMLLPRPRTQQAGYAVLPLSPPHENDKIRAAEAYLQANYREDVSTDDLARRAGLGARTFVRHFKAATGRHPNAYLQAVRIATAKAILEREGAPIQQVSSAVGYDDVTFFRSLFKRSTGMTPAEYRAQFGPLRVGGHAEMVP